MSSESDFVNTPAVGINFHTRGHVSRQGLIIRSWYFPYLGSENYFRLRYRKIWSPVWDFLLFRNSFLSKIKNIRHSECHSADPNIFCVIKIDSGSNFLHIPRSYHPNSRHLMSSLHYIWRNEFEFFQWKRNLIKQAWVIQAEWSVVHKLEKNVKYARVCMFFLSRAVRSAFVANAIEVVFIKAASWRMLLH